MAQKGVARALLDHGIQRIDGYVLASLWHANDESRKLFQSMGFTASQVVLRRRVEPSSRDGSGASDLPPGRQRGNNTNAPRIGQREGFSKDLAIVYERSGSDSQLSGSVPEETVILSVKDGVYYSLSDVGSRVWDLLRQPRSIDELVHQLTAEYAVESEQCRQDVHRLLQDMSISGLVSERNEQQVR